MANKCMKRTSNIICPHKLHTKTRYHTTHLLEWIIFFLKSTIANVGDASEQQQLVRMQNATTLEDSLAVSYKGKHTLTVRSSYAHTKTCTQMFIAALSIDAPNWKQPRYSSISERKTNCGTPRQWNITQC